MMACLVKALLVLGVVSGVVSSLAIKDIHGIENIGRAEPPQSNSTSLPMHHPKHCGEWGNFSLKWDDEPIFNPSDNNGIVYPPIFNPYHQLFFSNGYAYAPLPEAPYQPVSKPHLAIFLPNGTTKDIGSPNAAGARPGEIGAGPRASSNALWFNAYGAYFGCDNNGPEVCSIEMKGFAYNSSQGKEALVARQNMHVPACPASKGCQMRFYRFTADFHGLSGLQIGALVGGEPRIFFMDNLQIGWYNNSCEAGLQRLTVRK